MDCQPTTAFTRSALARFALLVLLAAVVSALVTARPAHGDEPRLRATDYPTQWRPAVMRLQTPVARMVDERRQHYVEHCTASLVVTAPQPILVTAWHCIEGQADLTRPPRVEVNDQWLSTRILASGGSMLADWAILTITDATPVLPTPLPLGHGGLTIGDRITIGGFSRDEGLGQQGKYLTYHPACQIYSAGSEGLTSDCLAFRGASGGPVIRVDAEGQAQLVGVISAGDSRSRSVLVPLDTFRSALATLL